jgi:Transcriptional regulator, AbiEi antitoxin
VPRSPHVDPPPGGKRTATGLDHAIAALARRQHGVVSRRQLLAHGFGRHAIDHRLATGRLHPIHRGVFAVGHRVVSRDGRLMAAVLVAGDAVVSHRSAAGLLGILRVERRPAEITVPRRLRARHGINAHEGRLLPDEITTRHGIPVTTAARTLLDPAAVVPPHVLERAATEAEIQRLTSPTSLAELAARYPTRTGTRATRTLVRRRDIGRSITRHELELRFSPPTAPAGRSRTTAPAIARSRSPATASSGSTGATSSTMPRPWRPSCTRFSPLAPAGPG